MALDEDMLDEYREDTRKRILDCRSRFKVESVVDEAAKAIREADISEENRHEFWAQLYEDLEREITLFDRQEISAASLMAEEALKVVDDILGK